MWFTEKKIARKLDLIRASMTNSTTKLEQVWDLSDLYQSPEDPAIDSDQSDLESALDSFCSKYANPQPLREDAAALGNALKDFAAINVKIHNLMVYAMLEWHVATQDTQVNSFRDRLNRRLAEDGNRLEFFRQFLVHLSPEEVKTLSATETVAPYAAFLNILTTYA